MSMSLDGYIAGPNDDPGNPGGDRFERLHEWFLTADGEFFRPSGPAGQLVDELNATGAVLAGRRTAEQADHWKGDHHGVPIFVPSHRPPGRAVGAARRGPSGHDNWTRRCGQNSACARVGPHRERSTPHPGAVVHPIRSREGRVGGTYQLTSGFPSRRAQTGTLRTSGSALLW
jgi:hypothetical protein